MSKKHERHEEDELRHHTYDGIQEFDKRLPNWWLFTLYGAIVFAAGYWAYFHWTDHMVPGYVRVERKIEDFQKAALATGAAPTDLQLFKLSLDPAVAEAGRKVFMSNCAACHGNDLKGGIGQNLVDAEWIHGGKPTEIYALVNNGFTEKGMPNWGPVLGQARIADVVAFIISQNPTIEKPAE